MLKASPDRFALSRGHTREVLLTTSSQIGVQLREVSHLRDGRGPASLQILHTVFNVWLLVAAGRHAEQWIEVVVAGQGLITRMQFSLSPGQNCRRHSGRIVPPQLSWYAVKKIEGRDHSMQDRFNAFRW